MFPFVLAWQVVPLVILLFLPRPGAADRTADGSFYVTSRGLLWGFVVPELVALIVPVAVIAALGWWKRVGWDSVPTARWVLAVPVLIVAGALIFTKYDAYTDRGAAFTVLALLAVLLIAASEELAFRGVAVELLRNGLREVWAAVVSTLLFALGHFAQGGFALPAVISAAMGGYLYYLTRRAAVFIAFPILVHASFDWFAFSHWGAKDDAAFIFFLYQTAIFVAVVALSRWVPPKGGRGRRRTPPVEESLTGEGPTPATDT